MSWSVEGVSLRWPGASEDVLHDVSLALPAGRLTAILGPNGAGKSTLLSLLAGLRAPDRGRVVFEGRGVGEWERRALARAVGVVPQAEGTVFPVRVRDFVAMGRYPHLGPWRAEGPDDVAAIADAMARADIAPLADRLLQTLSGGERQRALVARALAQAPRAFLLDEPTAALDVPHEMAILELLRAATDAGRTVVLVTHHLNLAARYADRLVLLDRGRVAAVGTAAEVLTAERLTAVFGWPVSILPLALGGPDAGVPQAVPLRRPAAAAGGVADPR